MPPRNFGTNQRVVDRLLADDKITREQHASVIEYVSRHQDRVEEAIIALEILSEAELLKYVATMHSTRFVSTEKLSKAVIDPRLLTKVPARFCDTHNIFPVLYDERNSSISVVTPDPDNDVAMHELRLAASVKQVSALVARPAGVRAAIALHYRSDKNAFVDLLRSVGLREIFRENDPFARRRSSIPPRGPQGSEPHVPRAPGMPVLEAPPQPAARAMRATQPNLGAEPVYAPPLPQLPQLQVPAPVAVAAPAPPAPAARVDQPDFAEALNVLVSLLENSRQDLRGHSSMVARLIRRTGERIGLPPATIEAYVAAGYIHDLGKMGTYHLTPLNVAEYEGHRIAAQKAAGLPLHLMESVGLSAETRAAVGSMYERWDGRGLPDGQVGKEIPLGARVLAIVDTYADLTQNPRNPYRKVLRPFEACEVLAQYRGQVFDPNIVDVFKSAMTGEDMRQKLLHDRHHALVVDPDPEETTVLELRLVEQGFEVKIARTIAQARLALETIEFAVVVSEVDVDTPDAGLFLREQSIAEGFATDVTWVMLTSKADRTTAQRAFDLNVDDFVAKPAATDIFAAKLRQLIERKQNQKGGRGVSGSLAEMSLPDMVQILWHGRKTCALRIQAKSSSGEIEFAEGQVVNARWDSVRGEEAFYKMITLREGDFRLDPAFKPSARVINSSPEALLLEGMRRLDEASSP